MTNSTVDQYVEHDARDVERPGRRGSDGDRSVRRAGVVAGVAILLMSALSVFGIFVAVEGLVTPREPAKTASDVMAAQGAFRLGIVTLVLVVVLDVVVAWAVFRVLSPVSEGLSRLAAWFRLAYSGVFLVAIGQLVAVPHLLGGWPELAAFTTEQLQAQALLAVAAFYDLWTVGLVLFGVHLVVVGFLAYKSGYVPRLLGVLLVVAGAGYVFDSIAAMLSPGMVEVSVVTFLGEFLLGLWLVLRGHRITSGALRSHDGIALGSTGSGHAI